MACVSGRPEISGQHISNSGLALGKWRSTIRWCSEPTPQFFQTADAEIRRQIKEF
jgi:hypothetical protein